METEAIVRETFDKGLTPVESKSGLSVERLSTESTPPRIPAIDSTTRTQSSKTPLSPSHRKPTSSSTRRRKRSLRKNIQLERHPESTDLGEPHDPRKGFGSIVKANLVGGMFSGRNSGNYERLEGGHGPGRPLAGRPFAWKKFAIGAAALITLVYLFGPRETPTVFGGKNTPSPVNDDYHDVIASPHDDSHHTTPPDKVGQGTGQELPPPSKPDTNTGDKELTTFKPPTSPKDDPDLSKTVHCTTPYKPNLPLVQYALMIDAGSTGSRIHIYKFNNCGSSTAYEYEVFKNRQPGLSSYKSNPRQAAESLDELMDEAVRVVPKSLRKCTPVAVKATAGLRLLGEKQSKDILDAVANRLREKYEFHLRSTEDVAILDGKDEGVFAWITANYLLHTIGSSSATGNQRMPEKKPTFAVLDLGGASTQIVFEPVFDEKQPDSMLKEGEHKYDLTFGGEKRVLYQHSYLGYGLKQAREHVHKLVEFLAPEHKDPSKKRVIANPCLASGTKDNVKIGEGEDQKTLSMDGADVGGFESCSRFVQLVMAKDAVCEVKPCSFNGVYQPNLMETFSSGKVLLLSYFYDRINPLLPVDQRDELLRISSIAKLAKDVCAGPKSWEKRWGSDKAVMEELEGRPVWCLDLTFMHTLLRLGYEFGEDRQAKLGKKIDGTELGWCLGATLSMIGADLTCRA